MTDEISDEDHFHSKVIGRLDGSGGELSALFDALDEADAAGHDVTQARDIAESVNGDLQEAFHAADSTDPDAEEVADRVIAATNGADLLVEIVSGTAYAGFKPEDADIGAYDTLGAYVEYVYKSRLKDREYAEMFVDAAR